MAFEESKVVIPGLEKEENLIAAARHIMRALGSKKNLTGDAKKILADLGTQLTQLSSMTKLSEKKEEKRVISDFEFEDQLDGIHKTIMRWEEDQSMIWGWDSGPNPASEFLNAANEAQKLIQKLDSSNLSKKEKEYKLFHKAYWVLQTAMERVEEEFKNKLIQHKQPFEPEYVSFRSSKGDTIADDTSVVSLDSSEESSRSSEEHTLDLVHPYVIPHLRKIAKLMFASNYDQECCYAYTITRRDALDEYFSVLEMDRLSIDDVLKMDWGNLNSKIKRWIWAVKIMVRVYLTSEKWLSDQIFGELEKSISLACFVDASKSTIFKILNFGEAMSIGPHQPEKLFKILDMYEVLASLIPEIDDLYSNEVGSCVRVQCHEVLKRLGACVRATFLEFEKAIASNASPTPFVGGGVHPLTRYVMNYVTILTDYTDTLNCLLPKDKEYQDPSTKELSSTAIHFKSLVSLLESNLEQKSKSYKEAPLQQLILMNNIHYMDKKVNGSQELRLIFGDEWIRKRNSKFKQHAINYERTTLSFILSLLKDEGIQIPITNSISKKLLTERLRSFYLAFEDLYRNQTAWYIPDSQLRQELRISLSLKLIQAYRTFIGRHGNYISDKYIKYDADDLENYLSKFFEGVPKSLHNPHRK